MLKGLFVFLFVSVCQKVSFGQDYLLKADTLRPMVFECDDKVINHSYRNVFGIYISNFYQTIDSLTTFLNDDKLPDKIIVLSPISQEERDTFYECVVGEKKRLIIGFVSDKSKGYKLGFINENAVLNQYDYMFDPLRRLIKLKNGIRIRFDFGSIISCQYEFDFLLKNGCLNLYKRKYWFFNKANPALEKKKSNFYKNKNHCLNSINIENFLVEIPDLIP